MGERKRIVFLISNLFFWMMLSISIAAFGETRNSVTNKAALSVSELSMPAIFCDSMILQRDKPISVWGKCKPSLQVTIHFDKKTASALTDAKGNWSVQLPAMKAGGPYTLTVTDQNGETITLKDVLLGDIWLCAGQSNMNFILAADANGATELASLNNSNIREYRAKMPNGVNNPENSEHSKWIPAKGQRAAKFSAVAYYFAKKIQETEHIPIGIIVMSCGDTRAESWIAEATIKNDPALKPLTDYLNSHKAGNAIPFNHRPAKFYDTVAKPLIPYAVKGVIWYQGESNTLPDNSGRTIEERASEYKYLLSDLIKSWRTDRNDLTLPFYLVQLPNYKDPSGDIKWATTRQAQLDVAKEIPHTGLAVTIDLGDSTNLHPENKAPVGERVARWALKNEYEKSIVASGPLIKQLNVIDNTAVLTFDFTAGGLASKTGKWLKGFAIADAYAPNVFIAAEAYIQGDKVIVSNSSVNKPAAVRYAWADNPSVSLYNNEGLPASPFTIKTP